MRGQRYKYCTSNMKPDKIGQIAKFHTPLPDEDPDQLYLVVEIHLDVENRRANIKALNTGLPFASIDTVLLCDLERVTVDTSDLLGNVVTITKTSHLMATGIVIQVSEQRILLDLNKGENGVETNAWLTIQDETGKVHSGTLFVN